MAEKFIYTFATLVAAKPEALKVERKDVDDSFSEITLIADKSDTGKLIGKEGKMISALKSVISGCKAKENRSYRIVIKSHEE
jgi:predicted RNA-binding protein YlqC (UPF0109 family)